MLYSASQGCRTPVSVCTCGARGKGRLMIVRCGVEEAPCRRVEITAEGTAEKVQFPSSVSEPECWGNLHMIGNGIFSKKIQGNKRGFLHMNTAEDTVDGPEFCPWAFVTPRPNSTVSALTMNHPVFALGLKSGVRGSSVLSAMFHAH